MRDIPQKGDLLQANEFLEIQKGVIPHELAFELFMDPLTKRANGKVVKDSPTTDETATAEASLKTESSRKLSQPAKRRTKDTAPLDRKGKDLLLLVV